MEASLPSFESPPLVEVVCGVLFQPLNFLAAHLGKYDAGGFTVFTEAPPLPPVMETFGGGSSLPLVVGSQYPMPRVWYQTEAADRMIQVQRDRFLLNWRKVAPEHDYPRFPVVFEEFRKQLEGFRLFVETELRQALTAVQFELTYINHIVEADAGQLVGRMGDYLPDLTWQPGPRFLGAPESVDVHYGFLMPNESGRLHMRLQNGRRNEDQAEVLVLDLTARGCLPERPEDLAWFDVAHEWIVKGFCDLTGHDAQHNTWKRTS